MDGWGTPKRCRAPKNSPGSFSRATVSGRLPNNRRPRQSCSKSADCASKPAPYTKPKRAGDSGGARMSAAVSTACGSNPESGAPLTVRLFSAIDLRSVSPKRSATTAARPARIAAAAMARPESATTSISVRSTNDFPRQFECIAEVEIERLVSFDHATQQARLHAILDTADGERADAQAGPDLYAVVLRPDALDARRRHRVDVGRDLQRWSLVDL